jgi:hypothetical protein
VKGNPIFYKDPTGHEGFSFSELTNVSSTGEGKPLIEQFIEDPKKQEKAIETKKRYKKYKKRAVKIAKKVITGEIPTPAALGAGIIKTTVKVGVKKTGKKPNIFIRAFNLIKNIFSKSGKGDTGQQLEKIKLRTFNTNKGFDPIETSYIQAERKAIKRADLGEIDDNKLREIRKSLYDKYWKARKKQGINPKYKKMADKIYENSKKNKEI